MEAYVILIQHCKVVYKNEQTKFSAKLVNAIIKYFTNRQSQMQKWWKLPKTTKPWTFSLKQNWQSKKLYI